MEFGSHFRGRQVETRTQIFAFCRPMWLQLLITNGSVKKVKHGKNKGKSFKPLPLEYDVNYDNIQNTV